MAYGKYWGLMRGGCFFVWDGWGREDVCHLSGRTGIAGIECDRKKILKYERLASRGNVFARGINTMFFFFVQYSTHFFHESQPKI